MTSAQQAIELSRELGFPLLVRPSYVLGGQRMKIVISEKGLEHHVVDILRDMPDNQILLDHFLEGAIECEADAICDGEDTYIIGVMQHIEPAGIHSGDSYAVLPPYNLGDLILAQIEDITKKVAVALETKGLLNIQFAVKDDTVFVIEANPRASRTVPFIAKAYQEPYVKYATEVMLGEKKVKDFQFSAPQARLRHQDSRLQLFEVPGSQQGARPGDEVDRRGHSLHRYVARPVLPQGLL